MPLYDQSGREVDPARVDAALEAQRECREAGVRLTPDALIALITGIPDDDDLGPVDPEDEDDAAYFARVYGFRPANDPDQE